MRVKVQASATLAVQGRKRDKVRVNLAPLNEGGRVSIKAHDLAVSSSNLYHAAHSLHGKVLEKTLAGALHHKDASSLSRLSFSQPNKERVVVSGEATRTIHRGQGELKVKFERGKTSNEITVTMELSVRPIKVKSASGKTVTVQPSIAITATLDFHPPSKPGRPKVDPREIEIVTLVALLANAVAVAGKSGAFELAGGDEEGGVEFP